MKRIAKVSLVQLATEAVIRGEDEYSYPVHCMGTVSTLPVEDEYDAVAALHAVVEEVTGIKPPKKEKPRMGFV